MKMPKGKAIKSAKQFRLMRAAASGKSSIGPSPEVAEKLLRETSHERKSSYAKSMSKKRSKKWQKTKY